MRELQVTAGVFDSNYALHLIEEDLTIPSGILIHPAVWPQRAWAENWGAVPLFGGGWVPI